MVQWKESNSVQGIAKKLQSEKGRHSIWFLHREKLIDLESDLQGEGHKSLE